MRKTAAARNADALAERQEQVKALTEKLENGVKAILRARTTPGISRLHSQLPILFLLTS